MISIIDSHAHFLNPALLGYPWLENLPTINREVLPTELPRQGDGWRIEKIVFVQAGGIPAQGLAEAEWVSGLKDERIAAIVAYAPLEQGEGARAALKALRALSLVKGVRRLIQDEAPGFASQPLFIEGVRLLADLNYTFDICVRHHQLPDALKLVEACPRVRFVLDHSGKPDIKGQILDPWRQDLRLLAAFPNVVCKLSGLITEADTSHWQPKDLRPYVDHVLTYFGTTRVMFGSDSPVIALSSSVEQWIETLFRLTEDLSASEYRQIFYENAQQFYGIE